jgi:pantoate--beta-alanine ligase
MKVVNTVNALQQEVQKQKKAHRSVGFVPTMGALHAGHLAILGRARSQTDFSIVSIFVNPKQFNDSEDLKRYPRPLDKDLEKLETAGCDMVFNPSEKEIYPKDFNLDFPLGYLDQIMEGKHRKGHFRGVITVVHRLFEIVQPEKAFFGEKDFQQLIIIQKMVRDLHLPVSIVPCPIVREADGLAMSSRNTLLSAEQRQHAPLIYKTLKEALHLKENYTIPQLKHWVSETINADPQLKLEYFEIVDSTDLKALSSWHEKKTIIGCIAAWAGKIRLIDNLKFSS